MNMQKIQPSRAVDKSHTLGKKRANSSRFAACFALIAICTLYGGTLRAADQADPKKWVADNLPSLVELYRHLHQTPELSEKEKDTSARMAKELRDIGVKVTTNVGGYGVVGVLDNGPGKVLLLRSDMDGLPVAEQTGLPYASKVRTTDAHGATVGVMHACGHDVHMTNLVGVARYLASHRDEWSGTVVFMFQPAEETSGGRSRHAAGRTLVPLPAARLRGRVARFGRRRRPAKSIIAPASRWPMSTASTSP